MPKRRFSPSTRQIFYDALCDKQGGEFCSSCRKPGLQTIEHVDGNSDNWSWHNLALLCQSCNSTDGANRRWGDRRERGGERDGERDHENEDAFRRRQELGYEDGETGHRANLSYEPQWKVEVTARCRSHGHITRLEAVDGMAEVLDCSTETTERYWRKAISPMGWLIRRTNIKNYPVWVLKVPLSEGPGASQQ